VAKEEGNKNAPQKLQVTKKDAQQVRQLFRHRQEDSYARERIKENVLGPAPKFDRERFWYVLLGCLLTSQQRSTRGSAVDRFLNLADFPLTLARCGGQVETIVQETLTAFGGIRMAPKIASRASLNLAWLESVGWPRVQRWFERLAEQRARVPQMTHSKLERAAARYAAINLEGIGPKQSRNLWQWLGLTRYETPLDSRVVKWLNSNLSVKVEYLRLADDGYYEGVMDYVQEVCRAADVLPCIWDAAAFDNEDTPSTPCVGR
jgi:N-glycosylase/DNA lyase